MDTIKYSIIIPAFNAAPYLSRCLDSILGQPYPDFEVIVVNDGSTDETLQILYDYARYHSNLVVLSQRNAGPGAARELGIKHASGDYIMFSDADDYWELDFLRGIDTYIKKRSPDILEFGYRKVSTKGEVISNGHVTHVELFGDRCLDHYIDQRNTTNYLCNKAFSARIFTDVVFPHLYTGEDAAVLIQLFSQARSYVSVPDIYYNYVMSAWSLTRAPFSIRKLDKLKSDRFKPLTLDIMQQ
ncbi:MAG TPA: glycosyltransferase family 2 protein [Bacillota bacterium]|nr:glycosyltransferase family 2 protein [Bacillota bacterium]